MAKKIVDLSAAAASKGTDLKEIYDPTLPAGTRSKKVTLAQDVVYINTNAQLAAAAQVTGFNAAAAAAAPVQSVAGKTGAVTLTPIDIVNLYGGALQSPTTGAAITYALTYPLAQRYIFAPNASVTLQVTLPAYDATQVQLDQPLEFINNGGANSAVQLLNNSGVFITNTSIGVAQSFFARVGINTVNSIRLGSLAAQSDITASQISDSTTAGRALITAADAAAQRTALGLGSMATQLGGAVAITGGLISSTNYAQRVSTVTGALWPIASTDAGSLILFSNAGATSVTIDSNANIPVPVGAIVRLKCTGGASATVTVSPTAAFTSAGGVIVNNTKMIVGNNGIIAVQKSATNIWEVIDLYEEYVHTTTWGGIWAASQAGNVTFVRNMREVVALLPAIQSTASIAALIVNNTSLPARLIPATQQSGYWPMLNNSVQADGKFSVDTVGGIIFYNGQFVVFTNSGTAGPMAGNIKYIL